MSTFISKSYGESMWSCPASVVLDGQETFTFVSRNPEQSATASVSVPLLNYSGKKVGVAAAYNEKVAAAEYPEMKTPQGAYITSEATGKIDDNGEICIYPNNAGKFDEQGVLKMKNTFVVEEVIQPGDLTFVIERNYTDIDRDTYYVVRAVNDIGEEGPPSEISGLVTRKPDEKAVISFEGSDNAEAEKIVAYRLYRASGGTNGSDFLFVKEIEAVNGGTVHDTLSEEELNEVMPKYGSVPKNLEGICGMSGGFIAAYKGKDIYFSEPYMPYCFPYEYSQSVPFDIVGVAVRSNYLYVMTKGSLYAFVGDHPETVTPLAMRFDVPCISRKSIAHVNGDIIYAGTTGLVVINNGGPQIFSDKLYTIEQYKNLHFENCIASGEYDGKYFAVFENKVMLFDFSDGNLQHTTLDKDAFVLSNYTWDDGSWLEYEQNFASHNTPYGETAITQDFTSKNLVATWRSKDFVFERPMAFTCARVRSADPDKTVNIKLFAENKEVFSGFVQHNKAFRIPVLRRECKWSVSVSSDTDITSVELAESMAEL